MNRTILVLFLLALPVVYAQQIEIKGQLLAADTEYAIPYASIYLKDGAIGTTTNEEGFFVF